MKRRRIWSELVPYDELCSKKVLELLRDRGIGMLVAVTPDIADGAPKVVRACRAYGVSVGLWPMLHQAQGRWPSSFNAKAFVAFVDELLAELTAEELPDELAIDLEPPIADLRGLMRLQHGAAYRLAMRQRPADSIECYRDLLLRLRGRSISTLAAAFPLVLADDQEGRGWQHLLGTPVDAIGVDCVSTMAYSSLLEGYSAGLLRRQDALALVGACAVATRRRYGTRACVSLGATGSGALGDEPTYRSERELAEDVAATRAAGIDDIVLFSLGGVLSRPPVERWLDVLVNTAPAPNAPAATLRSATLTGLMFAASRSAGAAQRVSRSRLTSSLREKLARAWRKRNPA